MKSPTFSKTPPNHAAGASLLEVLVTVVLLSVGLLGIAGTQTIGLKNVANASLRTQASVLAYDIVDRMRANRIAAEAGSYNIAIGAAPTDSTTIIGQDLGQWKTSLAGNLPQGDGAVAVAAGVVTVTLQWIEREGANGVMHTFQFNTRL
ncbi:MAG TPA: type IV pilus modification protein PilV [Xanthomonadaceae bacterium]|nr:type IV pilus modification protein PilV [Xanthomonadaceae bacterium]